MDQYAVNINGIRHVQQFDAKDAERLGLTDKDKVKPAKAKTAANKAATPANAGTPENPATPAS